jgi:heptosyltransferase-2
VPAVHLGLTAGDRAAADSWLAEHGIAPGFVALAPGSIWGTKRWPGYGELAARLVAGGREVVVVGGQDDRDLADEVVAAGNGDRGTGNGKAASAAGALALRASAALIARAEVLVTNDSAPLHLATATGTRIVAIFGPTVPAFGFGPRGPLDRAVEHPGLDCRPCSPHGPQTCPLGHHRCMRELPVERVLAAIG